MQMKYVLVVLGFLFAQTASAQSRIDFWQHQQKGVNCFNKEPARQWFEDAAGAKIRFVRLTFTKWQGTGRDFLLADADHFEFIPDADRKQLLRVLDWAHEFQIKVVVVPLSLPGARWSQQNEGKFDPRLWRDCSYHKQS
jgi:endoglucanase